ncbi:hypothetical protein AKJ66_01780 [candidate division MSBL1 archaeon SCGC-AAA259E22]|uniref:Glycyl-radical enzyme activating protein n=2 Tax=candidate division MSBL1 TaxID=215777 RepID=A0A133U8I2_9EURY|nr:hypothetical protein AKJ61_00550 [candidate division MSBL1 archaeon SCGC-AAA259B11]KXA93557.1 hypothetical protein AKJ66_01780 [candidate division MSBL1 archaeon SCGC-AAA259E22]
MVGKEPIFLKKGQNTSLKESKIQNSEKETGIIFNVEKFAYQDGPGIRTLVFLKGCPLNCLWCSNPESQNAYPELMYFENKCTFCGRCLEECPKDAIKMNVEKERVETNRETCENCGACTEVCLNDARVIKGDKITVKEIMNEIKKDDLFYRNTGGGVTITGGEPMMQPAFVYSILKRCNDLSIHTAIETSAYVRWPIFSKISETLDLLMIDIKHMDPEEHEKYTGVSNELILENIRKISEKPSIEKVIRIPIIPGINDDRENIKKTAKFVSEVGIETIELLPYHELGISKYKALGRGYEINSTPPDAEHLKKLKEIIDSHIPVVRFEGNLDKRIMQ